MERGLTSDVSSGSEDKDGRRHVCVSKGGRVDVPCQASATRHDYREELARGSETDAWAAQLQLKECFGMSTLLPGADRLLGSHRDDFRRRRRQNLLRWERSYRSLLLRYGTRSLLNHSFFSPTRVPPEMTSFSHCHLYGSSN